MARPATTPKNFHDSIRNMFTGASSAANSTGSLAYNLEQSALASQELLDTQTKHNAVALKIMQEQTKLLKKIAANDNGGLGLGTVVGGALLTRFVERIFGRRMAGLISGGIGGALATSIAGIGKKFGRMLVGNISTQVGKAFSMVAAAGRAIFAPLAGLKNIITASGAMKAVTTVANGAKLLPRLLGKLFLPITALMGIADAFSGWGNAESILGKSNVSFGDRVSTAIGTALNGLLLGIPDWIVGKLGGGNVSKLLAGGKDLIFSGISYLGTGIGNALKTGIQGLGSLVPSGMTLLSSIGTFVTDSVYGAFEVVKNAIWDGLVYLGTAMKDSVTGVFKDMWGSVKNWWNGTPGSSAPPLTRNSAGTSGLQSSPTTYGPGAAFAAGSGLGSGGGGGGGWGAENVSTGTQQPDYIGGSGASSTTSAPEVSAVGKPSNSTKSVAQGATDLGVSDYRQASRADINTVLFNRIKQDFDLEDHQVAGILGNFGHESDGYKAQQEYSPLGGGRGGLGFAQWTGARRKQLEEFAKAQGKSPLDFNTQYDFFKHELTNTWEAKAIPALRKTRNLTEATMIFEQEYERAGSKNYGSRIDHAKKALADYSAAPTKTATAANDNRPKLGDGGLVGPTSPVEGFLSGDSRKLLDKIDPDLAAVILNAQKHMPEGETFQVGPSTIRTLEQQAEFVRQGKSKTMNSRHLTGDAADLDIYKNGKYVGADHKAYGALEAAMKRSAAELGVDTQWGGDWKGSWDKPHWELKRGYKSTEGKILADLMRKGGKSVLPDIGSPALAGVPDSLKATPTSIMMTSKSQAVQPLLNSPVNPSQLQSKVANATFDSLIDKKTSSYVPPVASIQTGGVANDSSGQAPQQMAGNPGGFRVSDVPVVDEYKMMLANGSALT